MKSDSSPAQGGAPRTAWPLYGLWVVMAMSPPLGTPAPSSRRSAAPPSVTGVIVLDRHARVVSWVSTDGGRLGGRAEDEVVGSPISALWREDLGGSLEQAALLGRGADVGWLLGPLGHAYSARFSARSTLSEDGALEGFVIAVSPPP
jgi:hypothetical protein